MQECRQLNLRLAELTDVVQELLLPVAQRDEAEDRRGAGEVRQGPLSRWRRTRLLPRRSAQDRHDVPPDAALGQRGRAAPAGRAAARGTRSGEHLWASGVVREDPKLDRRGPRAAEAWDRIVADVNDWPGTAMVSHEFFAAASAEQARAGDAAARGRRGARGGHRPRDAQPGHRPLAGVREERLHRRRSTTTPSARTTSPEQEWDWGTLDLADVLQPVGRLAAARAGARADAARARRPRGTSCGSGSPRLVGIDPTACDASGSVAERVAGRGRGRAAAPGQRRPRRTSPPPSTAATGSAATSPRASWCRAAASSSGRRADRVDELRARGDRSVDVVHRRRGTT